MSPSMWTRTTGITVTTVNCDRKSRLCPPQLRHIVPDDSDDTDNPFERLWSAQPFFVMEYWWVLIWFSALSRPHDSLSAWYATTITTSSPHHNRSKHLSWGSAEQVCVCMVSRPQTNSEGGGRGFGVLVIR